MTRLLILLALLTAPAALSAQAADSGAFVVTLGMDTIAVERYTRSRDELRDDMVLRDRSPVITLHLLATLVRANLVGAAIAIDYSRPARRGRKIFGGLVPWNEVWRTGANAATRFTTSADLVMGGKTIPKGTYTLWTLPTPRKLIINTQTKAPCEGAACTLPTRPPLWGTAYSADSDLVRLDLRVERLPQPVEVFTIAIELQGEGGAAAARGGSDGGGGSGVLKMERENTRMSIPFTRK